MRTLQRHLLASLLVPTLVCLFAVTLMWVVYDLLDNYNDFIEAGAKAPMILEFYVASLPQALDAVLPLALLAGSLFTLANFSRTQQFTAMQSCGVGVWQMARPFLLVGLVFAVGHSVLHWRLAPQAERERDAQKARLRTMREKDSRKASAASEKLALLHHNAADRRIWFVGRASLKERVLTDVEILQTSADGQDRSKTYVSSMRPVPGGWSMSEGMVLNYDAQGEAVSREGFSNRVDTALSEPFEQVTGGAPKADTMSVPELRRWVEGPGREGQAHVAPFRTYLGFRLTAGLTCLAIAMSCVAFGIGNSRRNLFAGVSRSLLLFVMFFALTKLFIALGQGSRVPGWLGGAGPALAFVLTSAVLLTLRATSIELRSPWQWWRDRVASRSV